MTVWVFAFKAFFVESIPWPALETFVAGAVDAVALTVSASTIVVILGRQTFVTLAGTRYARLTVRDCTLFANSLEQQPLVV